MFSRQRLFWHRGPYDLPSTDQLFLQATADCCAFHMARCPQYRAIAGAPGLLPGPAAHHGRPGPGAHAAHPVLQAPRPLLHAPAADGDEGHLLGDQRHLQPGGLRPGLHLGGGPHGPPAGLAAPAHLFPPRQLCGAGLQARPAQLCRRYPHHVRHDLLRPAPPPLLCPPLAGGRATSLTWTVRWEALERFSRSPFPTRIVGFPSYLWFGLEADGRAGHLSAPAARFQDPAGRGLEAALAAAGGQVSALLPWSGGCWGWGRRTSMSCSAP